MSPDKVCSIIVACAVLHNIAIQWKQPLLEDEVSDDSYSDDVLDFEETVWAFGIKALQGSSGDK